MRTPKSVLNSFCRSLPRIALFLILASPFSFGPLDGEAAAEPRMGRRTSALTSTEASGKITYLRIHTENCEATGAACGAIKLDSDPSTVFYVPFNRDATDSASSALVRLLQEAYVHGWKVNLTAVDYGSFHITSAWVSL